MRKKIFQALIFMSLIISFGSNIAYAVGPSKVTIDSEKRLVVNGKLFFPRGFYLGPTEDEHLERIAKAGYNTIISYGYGRSKDPEGFLDQARKNGLWVLYSIKDCYTHHKNFPSDKYENGAEYAKAEFVSKLKGHPALLGWYINDEEYPSKTRHQQLTAMYKMVKAEDPCHPTFSVIHKAKQASFYYDVTDIIAPDPYPVPYEHIRLVSDWMDFCHKGMQHEKPVWVVPQVFSWGIYHVKHKPVLHGREPTFAEIRCMTYLSLIHDATGVIYYSYMDLWRQPSRQNENKLLFERRWAQMVPIGLELKEVSEVLLHGKKSEVKFTETEPDSIVESSAYLYNDKYYLLLVNPSDAQSTSKVKIQIPEQTDWKFEKTLMGDIIVKQDGRELSVYMGPYGCDTIVLAKKQSNNFK